ncbi:MAG: oxaloacetate decarboxylase [Candidatus Rokubacteria bacterium]|nr:oxaloacetate decarboxylase [Candidatus Rokubacteria bacterium]
MALRTTTRLRHLLKRQGAVVAPGVYDCVSAKLAERAGYEMALLTGAGVAASLLGVPDVGLLTLSELTVQARNICRATNLPVLADADTGYGNAINVMRTVRELEEAGVAGLFIEDQVTPKRCGHFEGKELISLEEMAGKIRAAREARRDPDLILMARTDAREVLGLEEAIRRARAYVAAGADMIFIEAPHTAEELRQIARAVDVPQLANLVEGGKTPLVSVGELGAMGFKVVSFSGSLQRAAIWAMTDFLDVLKKEQSVASLYPGRVVSLGERSDLLGLPAFYELERRFLPGKAP